jgi:hypothetical protein
VKAALLGAAAAGVTAAAAGVVLSDRAPYPYSLHRLLDIPLPLLTARRLDWLLEPRAGQQVLEIGPGTACSRCTWHRNWARAASLPWSTSSRRCSST